MRLALPGSALVHAGAVSLLFIGFVWPQADDAAAPVPVTVNIIPLSTVASNATDVIEANNTVSSLSAGGPETVQATPPETLEPVEETPAPAQVSPTVQAIVPETLDVAELSTTAASNLSVPTLQPVVAQPEETLDVSSLSPATPSPPLEPVETQTLVTPPAMPTPVSQRPTDQPRPRATPKPAPQPQRQAEPAKAGNGGNSQADSAASAGGIQAQQSNTGAGGEAEIARYPSQVIGKLRNAMRRGGDRGEMIVRFTVGAGGELQGVSVARSSGKAEVDAAGLALVQRAAPFPPIPATAQRNTWTFDVPLAFGG